MKGYVLERTSEAEAVAEPEQASVHRHFNHECLLQSFLVMELVGRIQKVSQATQELIKAMLKPTYVQPAVVFP